jgi:hypothetical protein
MGQLFVVSWKIEIVEKPMYFTFKNVNGHTLFGT